MPTLLVIDDDRSVPFMIERAVQGTGVSVLPARSVHEGLDLLERRPDVVLLDIMLPKGPASRPCRRSSARSQAAIIFITAGGTSDTTIEAMKLGAYDYLLKPLDLPKLRDLVERALEIRRLMQVRVELPTGESPSADGDQIIGRSPAMCEVFKAIGRVAPQNVTTLIVGESGTGKELVARAIYHHSLRVSERFLALNCAASRNRFWKASSSDTKRARSPGRLPPHRQVRAVRQGDDLSGRGGGHVPLLQSKSSASCRRSGLSAWGGTKRSRPTCG